MERQADDVRVGSVEAFDEGRRPALDGIGAGLAVPFAAIQIGLELGAAEPLEGDRRSNQDYILLKYQTK